ncbi:MAG: hypothetical protein IJL76_01140 [Bacilli bacterium]|nr:hypothetical protein [Bacilli bacterium]
MPKKSTKTTKKSSSKTTKPKTISTKKETKKVADTQELSNTFVDEVGQKSAVANLEDEIVEKRERKEVKEVKKVEAEKVKSNKPFKVFIIALICLLVGAIASYCYFELLDDGNNKVVVKYKNKSAKVGYDKDSITLKYLVDDYDYVGNFQVNVYNFLYSADEINVKDMEQDYLKLLAIKKADTDRDGIVSSIEFNDAVDYLFGGEIEFNNDEIKTDDILCAKYSYENGEYKKEDKECKGTSELRLQRKVVDVKELKDKMEVTVVVAILDNEKDKVGKTLAYDENGGQSLGDELEGVSAKDFVIDTSADDLNKFIYTFKYSKDNKNYYLENIKLDN